MKLYNRFIVIGILGIFLGCDRASETNMYGTWTTINLYGNSKMNIKDSVDFNEDGTYKLVMISEKDSIVNQMNGFWSVYL